MSQTVAFLHAHPDDEAIFTGGTMSMLAAGGVRVILIVATRGEQGTPRFPLPPGESVASRREAETIKAAEILAVSDVHFLGFRDSGTAGSAAAADPRAFAACDVDVAARQVTEICRRHGATALVGYDPGGIYAHPDHLMVHRVAERAGDMTALRTTYEATVDHEYLHYVDVHLVMGASRSLEERQSIGLPTAMISTSLDCSTALGAKWQAMAAHASQIPDADPEVPPAQFPDVYGWEWYVRHGPPGPIEMLG